MEARRVDSRFALLVLALGLGACNDDDPYPNIAPSAHADVARTRPTVPVDIEVLANDGDPDGGVSNLSVELVTQPANATASVAGNRVRVVPQAGFGGSTSFQYLVRDAQGAVSTPAQVTVDVAPTTRVLLATYSNLVAVRWSIADPTGEWPVASNPMNCGILSQPVRNSSGTQVVIMTCGSDLLLRKLVAVRPRDPTVTSREIVDDAQLLSNMVLSEDGSRVVVVQYDGDPNSVGGVTNYRLLDIDTATGGIRRSMTIDGVEGIHGFTGDGPARRIYLQVRDNSAGVAHPAILTADLATGTLARLDATDPNVNIEDSMPYANGDGLLFLYADQRLHALDSLTPDELQIPWEDPDAYLYPFIAIPDSDSAVIGRHLNSPADTLQQYWNVPLRNPGARRLIVQSFGTLTGSLAMKPDGRRMLYGSAPLPSTHSFIHEVSTEDGASFGTVGPSGGIEYLREFEYLGTEGDVLVATNDPISYDRLSIIRRDLRQVLVPLATDLNYFGLVYRASDAEGTGVAFSVAVVPGTGRLRPFLADVNLPGVSWPLGSAIADDDDVYVLDALGPPLP